MARQLVYHWKHGWIPLTHAAALSKAHGSAKLADKYVPAASHHHGGLKTRGMSARQIHAGLAPHAATRTTPSPEHFRMSGEQLRERAAAGDHGARTELERRTARRAEKHAAPSAPPSPKAPQAPGQAKSMTPRELHEQNRGDLKVGDRVSLKTSDGNRVGIVKSFDAHGRAQVDVPGHGTVTRTAADLSKTIHPATEAAEQRRQLGDWSKTPTGTLERALGSPSFRPEVKAAMREELQRRGVTPNTSSAAEHAIAKWEAENRQIAPAGHTISSRVVGTYNGVPHGIHTQHAANGERVGSVIERHGGEFRSLLDGKPIGDYRTRAEAHAALASRYTEVKNAERATQEAAASARQRRSAKAAVGLFQPHQFESDGTRAGDAAASKIKQSFALGEHRVHIENAMSREQTQAFLSDVHSVLLKANLLDGKGITFHVPTGDSHFRATRRGVTGGYVRQGQRTVFVNPQIANGKLTSFGGPTVTPGNFMPAAAKTNSRQYVITHELGHVLDHEHGHTRETTLLGSRHVAFTSDRAEVADLRRQHLAELSRYGRTNSAESYAEAYAQWIHGGPGSSAVADAYAAEFGWVIPKWYREGRKAS